MIRPPQISYAAKESADLTSRLVLVWDAPIRLFHWLTVLLVAVCYATERLNWMVWHVWLGTVLLALVFFRLLWGVLGSETARFHRFLASPAAALHHLAQLFRREPDHEVGHNAAGGWMVMVLLALLLGETLSGLYVNNEVADEGPLSEMVPAPVANAVTALHEWLWYALLSAIALHVIAIAAYAVVKGHHLLRPMVTGRKSLPTSVAAPHTVPFRRAVFLLLIAAAAAGLLTAYL
jgi:cytochrome b